MKGGLVKLGIIKDLENILDKTDHKINEKMYDLIRQWKSIYEGYYSEWHDITYHTIDGVKNRRQETLNMAKISSSEMASLVFNSKCEISIGDDENATSDYISHVLRHNRFYKKFQDYLEYGFAMGGLIVKPYAKDGEVKLSYVTADCFVPLSWENETINSGVFINESFEGDKTFNHYEFHTWIEGVYTITNELYETTNGITKSTKVPLSRLYPDLEEVIQFHKAEKQIFVYIKPNTANNFDTLSPLGIPIYANAMSTMKSLDTAFDSFHREFRLGQKRIIVPEEMIRVVYDANGRPNRYFDATDETYQAFSTGTSDNAEVRDISVELRVDEHINAINSLLNLYAMQTGFSSGTFSFDGQSMKTATEVISEQSKTFKTKQSHEVIIEAGIQEIIESVLVIAETFDIFIGEDDIDIQVMFDDSIAEDKGAEIDNQIKLTLNNLQSKVRAIRKIFGMTEEEALKVLDEINAESGERENTELEAETVLFGGRE